MNTKEESIYKAPFELMADQFWNSEAGELYMKDNHIIVFDDKSVKNINRRAKSINSEEFSLRVSKEGGIFISSHIEDFNELTDYEWRIPLSLDSICIDEHSVLFDTEEYGLGDDHDQVSDEYRKDKKKEATSILRALADKIESSMK